MYKKIKAIQKNKNLKVKEIKTFKYAKDLSESILTIDEFFKACKSFPIVFGNDSENNLIAMAILGINNKNLFVNSKGEWRKGEYIPFYVRRYPFNFYKKDDTYVLVYDESSKVVNEKEGVALFDEDLHETEYLKNLMTLMKTYQITALKTEKFVEKLEELELLEDAQINIKREQQYVLRGFKKVNEEKLNNLSDETKLELVKNGMYNLIIAHLISLDNVHKLAVL